MTNSRSLDLAERMTDALDRCFTMDFCTLARVRGDVDEARVREALAALTRRHPLLSARIERRGGAAHRLVLGEAAPIACTSRDTSDDAWKGLSFRHHAWEDAGPRARLEVLRHGDGEHTLVLTLHHVVSDGGSGALAMRDLLSALGEPERALPPIESPGQAAYYPESVRGLRRVRPTLDALAAMQRPPRPARLRPEDMAPPEAWEVGLVPIVLDEPRTTALARAAKRSGSTLHGVVSSALCIAIAKELGRAATLEVLHPVDLRRRAPGTPADVVGCYVSSIPTRLHTEPEGDVLALARETTKALHAGLERGVHWATSPGAGAILVGVVAAVGPSRAARLLPRHAFAGALSVTNLGALERYGLEPRVGGLEIRRVGFAASPSVTGALIAAVSTFAGSMTIALGHTMPLVSRARAARIVEHATRLLEDAAHEREG